MRWILWIILLLAACTAPPFDEDAERSAILRLHEEQRTVHFQKRVQDFVDLLSKDHISVNRGKIDQPTSEQFFNRFSGYFGAVDFIRWDDLNEPIIRFSEDGTLAYTIVDKEVTTRYLNDRQQLIRERIHYAWTAIYRKNQEGWKIESVTSTNEPPEEEILTNWSFKADCLGPNGQYQTQVSADSSGYLCFQQQYSYRDTDFTGVIKPDGTVYSVDSEKQNVQVLSAENQLIMAGHDFPGIFLMPERYFPGLAPTLALQRETVDALGHPVTIVYGDSTQLPEQLLMRNPTAPEEVIDVRFLELKESHWGRIPQEVLLIQAQKDTFSFHFTEFQFNDTDFRQLSW